MKTIWILVLAMVASPILAQETPTATGTTEAQPSIEEETRVPLLVEQAVAAYQAQDHERMEALLARAVELRPYLAQLRFMLAKAHALQDEKRQAYDALVKLQSSGLSFDLASDDDFANLRGFQLYDYLVEKFAENAQPFGQKSTAFVIDRKDLFIESIAHDPEADRFLVGSVIDGTVYAVNDEGRLSAFITPNETNGLLGIVDLEVDAANGVLWVVSGASPHVAHARLADRGKSLVHKFDLETGKQIARFTPQAGGSYLLDLARSPDGQVFVTDSARPVIWTIPASAASGDADAPMEVFFAAGSLSGIRAVTVDDAGKHLYFSDYEMGLFGVEIEAQKPFMLHLGENLNLSGIDALEWYDDGLVLVQNGVVPRRVLRFQLFDDAQRGRHAQAVLSGLPEFRNPVATTIVGDDLLLIANSHRNAYDPRTGALRSGAEVAPHTVLKADLRHGWMPPKIEDPMASPSGK